MDSALMRTLVAVAILWCLPASAHARCVGAGCQTAATPFDGSVTGDLTFKDSGGVARAKMKATADGVVVATDAAGTAFNRQVFSDPTTGVSLRVRADLAYLAAKAADDSTWKNFSAAKFYMQGESYLNQCADGILCYHYSNGWIGQAWGSGVTVASASSMPAPAYSSVHVTGTTGFNSITTTGLLRGFELTYIFDGVVTVTTGTGNIRLAGAANFTSSADDTLTLVWDGTNWYEKCRSVN